MLPKILKNFNVFVDGRGFAGRAEEITLPKLTIKTEEFLGAGMSAPVEVDMGMEKSDKHKLMITIGAALSGTFESAVSGASSKIKGVGSAIKELENQSLVSGNALKKLKTRYNSLLASLNDQQAIKQKRGYYRSQITGMVALGASLAAPIKAAMNFQNALAGIKAVVNFPEPDGLKKLGDELSRISKEVPKTVEDLAKIGSDGT